jgi:hypothetical protein
MPIMAIEFREVLHFNCDTGDPLTLQDKKWDCIIPCLVIGVTADDQPVLAGEDGPKLNTTELIQAGILRTLGEPGQTPAEVMILGEYLKIRSKDLQGKKVLASKYTSGTWLIICEDKTYIKQGVERDMDGELYMSGRDITLGDLHALGQVDDATYEEHKCRQEQGRQAQNRKRAVFQLRQATRALGVDAARAVIEEKL